MAFWMCECGYRSPAMTHWCSECGRPKRKRKKKAGVELSQKVLELGKELDKTRREREELRQHNDCLVKRTFELRTTELELRNRLGASSEGVVIGLEAEVQNLGHELTASQNDRRELWCNLETQKRYVKEAHQLIKKLKQKRSEVEEFLHIVQGTTYQGLSNLVRCLRNDTLIRLAQVVHNAFYRRIK